MHAEQTIESIYSGAAGIFVEKPLAVNTEDAYHILDLATTNKTKIVVGYNFRYHPGIHRLIGSVIHANFWLTAVGIDDITTWPTYKTLGENSYIHSETGGLLWTSGSHAIDIAIFLHGEVSEVLAGTDEAKEALVQRLHHIGGGISILYNKWKKNHPQTSLLTYMSPADSIIVDLLSEHGANMHEQLMINALKYFNNGTLDPNLPTLSDSIHGICILEAVEKSLQTRNSIKL
jgi:predicted dehydrogenase